LQNATHPPLIDDWLDWTTQEDDKSTNARAESTP
jgi:hypothetical protein